VTLEPIGDDVRRELGRFGQEGTLGPILDEWVAAVGDAVAANAWPSRVARDGTLHVATASSTWAFELTQLEPRVRQRLTDALGDAAPRRLRFAVGPLPERGPEAVGEVRRNAPKVSKAEQAEGRRIAREIADSGLRELVARAVAASLAGPRADRSL
jgi:hypothetical protein